MHKPVPKKEREKKQGTNQEERMERNRINDSLQDRDITGGNSLTERRTSTELEEALTLEREGSVLLADIVCLLFSFCIDIKI